MVAGRSTTGKRQLPTDAAGEAMLINKTIGIFSTRAHPE
jgi:hypothetical protein